MLPFGRSKSKGTSGKSSRRSDVARIYNVDIFSLSENVAPVVALEQPLVASESKAIDDDYDVIREQHVPRPSKLIRTHRRQPYLGSYI